MREYICNWRLDRALPEELPSHLSKISKCPVSAFSQCYTSLSEISFDCLLSLLKMRVSWVTFEAKRYAKALIFKLLLILDFYKAVSIILKRVTVFCGYFICVLSLLFGPCHLLEFIPAGPLKLYMWANYSSSIPGVDWMSSDLTGNVNITSFKRKRVVNFPMKDFSGYAYQMENKKDRFNDKISCFFFLCLLR